MSKKLVPDWTAVGEVLFQWLVLLLAGSLVFSIVVWYPLWVAGVTWGHILRFLVMFGAMLLVIPIGLVTLLVIGILGGLSVRLLAWMFGISADDD